MSITVNNKDYKFVENETVSELLLRLQFRFPLIIVKINDNYISRDKFAGTVIPDHASIFVIHMISGG